MTHIPFYPSDRFITSEEDINNLHKKYPNEKFFINFPYPEMIPTRLCQKVDHKFLYPGIGFKSTRYSCFALITKNFKCRKYKHLKGVLQ